MSQQYRPDLYAVLEAIARGIDSRDRISEELGLEGNAINEILRGLEAAGLIRRTTRGLIIKREAYTLTPSGWRKLDEWRERAKKDLERAEELRKAGREEEAAELLQPYLAFLPFLLALEHLSILGLYDLIGSGQGFDEPLANDLESSYDDLDAAEEF